ncbi:hypothetical protein KI387_038224, partial [Taxus chinensis]
RKAKLQPTIAYHITTSCEEYRVLSNEIRDAISLTNFNNLQESRGGPRVEPRPQTNQRDLQESLEKLSLPTFDGSSKTSPLLMGREEEIMGHEPKKEKTNGCSSKKT